MNFTPEKITPYFQPILSADSKSVYSYEILGRYIDDNGAVQSLGNFFNDDNTTNEDALRIDRHIRSSQRKRTRRHHTKAQRTQRSQREKGGVVRRLCKSFSIR